ncbi:MAG: hypothetical protein AB7P60_21300 [Hyphomicrobiaceae bacterium]
MTQRADSIVDAIYRNYEDRARASQEWKRRHLGASVIGHKCDRYLWLHFRWARDPKHPGQRLRLFDRGNVEEPRLHRDLQAIGWTVRSFGDDGAPRRQPWAEGMHVGGGGDRYIEREDGPIRRALMEGKTANAKQFARLVRLGVREAKPDHYIQAQVYMAIYALSWCLYLCVNKDDEGLHAEWIAFDEQFALAALHRANAIVLMKEPPAKLAANEYPPCRWTSIEGKVSLCEYYRICHGDERPERNCRTCIHATAAPFGQWRCEDRGGELLSRDQQAAGCGKQRWIPPIINAQVAAVGCDERHGSYVDYQFADGTKLRDVGPRAPKT